MAYPSSPICVELLQEVSATTYASPDGFHVRIESVMNRSVERLCFPVRGTSPGELAVGLFVHPKRGHVRCPATSLVAASLRAKGHDVREELDRLVPADDAADGVLFTASYLDHLGEAVGLAVAAHKSDEGALRIARETVLSWSAAWRSRRLVLATPEPCHPGERQEACPHVAEARQAISRFVARGDQVVLVGTRGQAASESLAKSPDVVLVESATAVDDLRLDPDRVAYVLAPGLVLEQAMRVVAAVRARYPRLRGQHPSELCYAASDDLATVRAVAAACDRVLVLGTATTPDTAVLVDAAAEVGTPADMVDCLERIRPSWLAGTESIGLVTAPSVPPLLFYAVIAALTGMGPLSIVRRSVTTKSISLDATLAALVSAV